MCFRGRGFNQFKFLLVLMPLVSFNAFGHSQPFHYFQSLVKTSLVCKTCLYIFDRIAYKFNRELIMRIPIFFFIKTILKAERWARDNGLPFPQIEGNPVLEDPEFKECYVFEDTENPECPTILHFPLINNTFKEFSEPGKECFCFASDLLRKVC